MALGHSSPSITQVYADVMNSDVEEALQNLELDGRIESQGSFLPLPA